MLPWAAARRTDAAGAEKVLADPGATDVFVRGDGTHLAVFPNRFVLDRFAQRNPNVQLDRLIGADEPA
jgi:peptide chain release factor 3